MVQMYHEIKSTGQSPTLDHVRRVAAAQVNNSQRQVVDLDGALVGTVAAGEDSDSSDDEMGDSDEDGDDDMVSCSWWGWCMWCVPTRHLVLQMRGVPLYSISLSLGPDAAAGR